MLGMPMDEPMYQQGFNYNSPTVGYVMGGMGNIPPNPIGNTLNVGGYGYNYNPANAGYMGGYYGGGYGGGYQPMMNPYLYQQQLTYQEAALREQERRQSDLMKTLSRVAHNAIGDMNQYENFDEHLKQYDPIVTDSVAYSEEAHYNKLATLQPMQPNYAFINHCNAVSAQYKAKCPDNMGLFDYLDRSGELRIERMLEQSTQLSRDGKLQYDTTQYRKLLEDHRSTSSYFNSLITQGMGPNKISIDDMEIELPQYPGDKAKAVVNCPTYLQPYASRKNEFLQAILKNSTTL